MNVMTFTQEELDNEEWRDILGYDYQYQISDLGRFRRVTCFKKNMENTITLGSFDSDGYLRISLVKNKKYIGKKLHRLVGEYFFEDYSENITMNHIDFVKNNNRKTNLELMTFAENALDFITKIRKEKSSSKCLGVNYHKQTCKWVARITVDRIRLPLGSYLTEDEACQAVIDYKEGNLAPIAGKGQSLIGRQKFTEKQIEDVLILSYEVGVRKASEMSGISTTTISTLRKKLNDKRNK